MKNIFLNNEKQPTVLTTYKKILERLNGRIKMKKKILNMDRLILKAKRIYFSKKSTALSK